MLEQKTENLIDLIWDLECSIDEGRELYLITWSPDPKELPDADFYLQHNINVQILSDYLKCCYTGAFCVESTQMGNPHYHGWYQVESKLELCRIAIIKTMGRFGIVKIVKARSYKIFNWSEKCNALYYYKKDVLDAMYNIDPNPITKDSLSTVDFDVLSMVGFFSRDRYDKTIQDKISDRKFYRDFYSDTIVHLKS